MALLKLKSVTCNGTAGGRIQLQIGPDILLGYSQIATLDESLPKTVNFSDQGLALPFIGTVAIELYDESLLITEGNSVASSVGITETLVESEDRTLIYRNNTCFGDYIVTYEVDSDFPGVVLALFQTVATAFVTIIVAIAVFIRDLSILLARPFTRFSDRRNQNSRMD
jgi:hypothetical protein